MSIYQFAFHSGVSNTPPVCNMSILYDKCKTDIKSLTKEEYQEIFDKTRDYENGLYKIAGWAFDFREFMFRFIVQYKNSGNQWITIFAFNKTNIRKNLYTRSNIAEIHKIKNYKKKPFSKNN